MSLRGFTPFSIQGPRGPWTRLDHRPVPTPRGSAARNVRFEPNRVKTRDGFQNDFAVSAKVKSLYNWITNYGGSEVNRIVYMENNTVKMRDMVALTTTTLFTQAGRSAPPAEAASRLYIPVYTDAGIGASQARIVNALIGGAPSDYAFAGPMTISPTMTATGAGNCTPGSHLFGYILETRSGFLGKPSPFSGSVFSPVSFTVAAGGKTLNMAVSGTMPADSAYLHPIMTRIDNPNRWYFVPDASVAIPAGAWTANMTINISDEDLADSATQVDEHFDYITQDTSGTGPFNPHLIIEVGQRLAYLTPQRMYVSDQQAAQVITEAENALELPGQRQMITAFTLRDNLYVLANAATYGFSDNGDRPVLWGAPELVSGRIGTTGVRCVQNRTGGDYAWVANYSGLYFFDGQYDERPISYMNDPEWKRINWAVPNVIQIEDDYVNQRVMVAVPLDGATEPTHILTWDYSRGFKWSDVDFSLDNLPSSFSSLGMVRDRTTGRYEVWVGPAAAGNVLRQIPNLREDAGSAINSQYETCLLVPRGSGWKFMKMGWLEFDVVGAGNLDVTVNGLDRVYDDVLDDVTMATAPGDYPLLGLDFNDQNFSILVGTSAAGSYFDICRITGYMVKWMTN